MRTSCREWEPWLSSLLQSLWRLLSRAFSISARFFCGCERQRLAHLSNMIDAQSSVRLSAVIPDVPVLFLPPANSPLTRCSLFVLMAQKRSSDVNALGRSNESEAEIAASLEAEVDDAIATC